MQLSKKAEASLREVIDTIERASTPDEMETTERIQFLHQIGDDVKMMIETIKEENDLD